MDNDNGKITLAVLGEKIDHVNEQLRSLAGIESRLRAIEISNASTSKQVHDNENEIDRLRDTTTRWNGVNTILAIIGSTIAAVFGANK